MKLKVSATLLVKAIVVSLVVGHPVPQNPEDQGAITQDEALEVSGIETKPVTSSVGSDVDKTLDEQQNKFGEGSQLQLALSLSNAKPQAVEASSYAGRKKRSPQDTTRSLDNILAPLEVQETVEENEINFGGSQLQLALQLSDAKTQAVEASSYAGKKKRSPQDTSSTLDNISVSSEVQETVDEHESKFGAGSQLQLALQLSDAKPQAVEASSYAGKKKRSPQDTTGTLDNISVSSEVQETVAEHESKFGAGSQLQLALQLSDAKPQAVEASSYAGKKKRSPQDTAGTLDNISVSSEVQETVDEHESKFGAGSQLQLALQLSDAKPQAVEASSYAGKKKRSPQEFFQQQFVQDETLAVETAEDHDKRFGGSQLQLALQLSHAKPQPVSESSYGGKKKRSPHANVEPSSHA